MLDINPDIIKSVRNKLIWIIRKQADELSNINNLIEKLQEKTKDWSLMPAVAFYAGILYLRGNTESERLALFKLIDSSIQDLELENEFLAIPSPHTPPDRKRMLFHAQLALATILLIKSNRLMENTSSNAASYADGILLRMRALTLIKGMSSIESFVNHDNYPYTQPGPTVLYMDIGWAKTMANEFIFPLLNSTSVQNPGEYLLYALGTIKEYTHFPFIRDSEFSLVDNILSSIDIWAGQCQENKSKEKYERLPGWLDLFTGLANFLPYIDPDDNMAISPNKCKKESSQYFSWRLGYEIGRCAQSLFKPNDIFNELRKNLTAALIRQDWLDEADLVNENKEILKTLQLICSYISGYNKASNWNDVRTTSLTIWGHTYHPEKLPLWSQFHNRDKPSLSKINPESDLYWAICIGLADAMIGVGTNNELRLTPDEFIKEKIVSDVELSKKIEKALSINGLQDDNDKSRLRSAQTDIETIIKSRIGDVYQQLPDKDLLKSCVRSNQTYWEMRHSIYDFDSVVKSWMQLILTFSLDKNVESFKDFHYIRRSNKPILPSGLSNAQWGHILKEVAGSIPDSGEYNSYRMLFESYCKKNFPNFDPQTLKPLGKTLLGIGDIRNKILHEPEKEITQEKMPKYLSEMDILVLGSENKTGVIVELFKIFGENRSQLSGWGG